MFNLKDLAQLPTLKEMEEMTLPEIPGEQVPMEELEDADQPQAAGRPQEAEQEKQD